VLKSAFNIIIKDSMSFNQTDTNPVQMNLDTQIASSLAVFLIVFIVGVTVVRNATPYVPIYSKREPL
jgi:hypothetical protein